MVSEFYSKLKVSPLAFIAEGCSLSLNPTLLNLSNNLTTSSSFHYWSYCIISFSFYNIFMSSQDWASIFSLIISVSSSFILPDVRDYKEHIYDANNRDQHILGWWQRLAKYPSDKLTELNELLQMLTDN